MKITAFNDLITGGISGNLGLLLFSVFFLFLPNICLLIKAIRIKFYFLKFLQYPGLIIFAFYLFVFFLRRDRWASADWRANYLQFTMSASVVTNALSLFVIRKYQSALMWLVPLFVAAGFAIYSMI